jgi:hypothetical protein
MKKNNLILLGAAGIISLLAGCSTAPVALAPVGPAPAGISTTMGNGQLEVYSALSGRTEGNNPSWRQHSDYYIYDNQGKRLQLVDNAAGHYASSPRTVALPAGNYIVKARAKGALWTKTPVVIEPGEITRVHLDGQWQPEADTSQLVYGPDGYPVGWSAGVTRSGGAK